MMTIEYKGKYKYLLLVMLKEYLKLSILAYDDNPKSENLYNIQTFNNELDVNGFYAYDKDNKKLYISFRGTECKFKDIIFDLLFKKLYIFKGVKVHSGFLLTYLSIRQKLLSLIIDSDIEKIVVTGHSMGGALATLCAFDMKNKFENKSVECFTFGSPRVGNRNFSKEYNKMNIYSFRVVNGSDVVENLPYSFLGYKHVNDRIRLGEKRKCYNYFWGKCGKDHYYTSYEKELDKAIKESEEGFNEK